MKKAKKQWKYEAIPKCNHRLCPQQAYLVPDYSQLPVRHKEPSARMYREPDGSWTHGGNLTSTVSYRTTPHPSGLCYFHLKHDLRLFDAEYPLKYKSPTMFDGRTK